MTDITENPDNAPAPKPVIQRIMDAIDEVVDQREQAAAAAVRAQNSRDYEDEDSPRRPLDPWNDLWTIKRRPAAPASNTETLLNNLIDECGFLMREVAFRLMRTAPDYDMAALHMNRAMALAETGAKVGLTVAKLRKASAAENRQTITLERVERLPEIEKPSFRANE